MKVHAFSSTHAGTSKSANEDAIALAPDLGLFIVCDGSSTPQGAIAAQTACQVIRKVIEDQRAVLQNCLQDLSTPGRIKASQLLERAIQEAGAIIFKKGQQDLSFRGAFTTIDAALVLQTHIIIAHVGDGRAYLVRGGKAHRLTTDHTFLSEMVRDGTYSPEEAVKKPFANNLTRAVGATPYVQVDLLQLEAASQDCLVLCTDGLSDLLKSADFAEILSELHPDGAVEALVQRAVSAGTRDNATAVIIQAEIEHSAQQVSKQVMEKVEVIREIPMFKHLAYNELIKVLSIVEIQNVEAGVTIIEKDAVSNEMFIVLNGGVAVKLDQEVVAQGGRGEIVGEMGLFDKAPRSATVVTTEASALMVLGRVPLFKLMREDSELAVKLCWGLIQGLGQKVRARGQELLKIRKEAETLTATAEMPFFLGRE